MSFLNIDGEYITTLAQFKELFHNDVSYSSPIFFDLLDYGRTGGISSWLREHDEPDLALEIEMIADEIGDSEYISRLSQVILGVNLVSPVPPKPAFGDCLRIESVDTDTLGERMNVRILIKVLKVLNERYELLLVSDQGKKETTVNPFAHKCGDTIVWEHSFQNCQDSDVSEIVIYCDGQIIHRQPVSSDIVFTVEEISFKMIRVKHGSFMMGALPNDSDAADNEKPQHKVTISKDFYIGETPVTRELWQAVMGTDPSYFCREYETRPVECISKYDCHDFVDKLNQLTEKTFSLPTEAQWEYAARGGIKSKGYKYSGNYSGGYCGKTQPVKSRSLPNELGIYDMSGNVWEWCEDSFNEQRDGDYTDRPQIDPCGNHSGYYAVSRGGCHSNGDTRISIRELCYAYTKDKRHGFRLVLIV